MNDAQRSATATVLRPMLAENPITLQILGICSALAVTRTLETALVMSGAVIAVLVVSGAAIASMRRFVPRSIRLIVQITIIASLVIVVDQVIAAFAWETSKRLSIFVSLIVTNCIVLGRAESFAMHHPPARAALDGLGNGLGYALILLCVGVVRELLGAGTLLGVVVLPPADEGGWFVPNELMGLPPSAFFLLALIVWAVRTLHPEQNEAPEPGAGGER